MKSTKGKLTVPESIQDKRWGGAFMNIKNLIKGNSGGPIFHETSHELVAIVSTSDFVASSGSQWLPHANLLGGLNEMVSNDAFMKALLNIGPLHPNLE